MKVLDDIGKMRKGTRVRRERKKYGFVKYDSLRNLKKFNIYKIKSWACELFCRLKKKLF